MRQIHIHWLIKILRNREDLMRRISFIILCFGFIVLAEEMAQDKWVYFKKPVPYNMSKSDSSLVKDIPGKNTLKNIEYQTILLENLEGKELPRFKYANLEIQIADSLEAYNLSQKIPSSEIIYDEMGYQQYDWAIRSSYFVYGSQVDSVCSAINGSINSAYICTKSENTALIVFGKNMSNEKAQELVQKLKSLNISAKIQSLKYIEVDL